MVQFTGTPAYITCAGPMTGVLNCVGATFAGPLTIAGGSTLNISDSVAVQGALTNSGTVNWLQGNVYLDTCTSNLAGPNPNLDGPVEHPMRLDQPCLPDRPERLLHKPGHSPQDKHLGTALLRYPLQQLRPVEGPKPEQSLSWTEAPSAGLLSPHRARRLGLMAAPLPARNAGKSSGLGQVQFAGSADVTFSQSMIGV